MPYPTIHAPAAWAVQTFGDVQLGDPRRRRRVLQVAAALAQDPSASLPVQLQDLAALKGGYHLLHSPHITHHALSQPHWTATRDAAGQQDLVLLVGDLMLLDYSHHPTTRGLGPIGDGRGRGYVVHSVLALTPAPRQVLGLAHQIPRVPPAKRRGETLRQRQKRGRQSDLWEEAVTAIGRPPAGVRWVHVGDRASDIFRFLTACREHDCHFLVRAKQDRRVEDEQGEIGYLKQVLRGRAPQGERLLALRVGRGEQTRTAAVAITWQRLMLQIPQQEAAPGPLEAWAIRVWEPDPPTDVAEPIEWFLLSSVPTSSEADAWERVSWYRCRWTIEDYHQALKMGCRIEERTLRDQAALERLLGLCAPIAVQLLQVRDAARQQPDCLATTVLDPEVVAVVATLAGQDAATMTIQALDHAVAKRGGWLGRTGDGPPGWRTLWAGWQQVRLICEGVRLARGSPVTSG
jgi:hypothetical protein